MPWRKTSSGTFFAKGAAGCAHRRASFFPLLSYSNRWPASKSGSPALPAGASAGATYEVF